MSIILVLIVIIVLINGIVSETLVASLFVSNV